MGRRVEIFLVMIFIALLFISYSFVSSSNENKSINIESKKSTELSNFTQYDINKTDIEYKLSSPYAEEIGDVWYVKSPKISNEQIKLLKSDFAVAKGKIIEFIKNVVMLKKDGKKYNSQKAIYNSITKVVLTPDRFNISKEYNMVNGINLEYFSDRQVTKAKNVKATFILKRE